MGILIKLAMERLEVSDFMNLLVGETGQLCLLRDSFRCDFILLFAIFIYIV